MTLGVSFPPRISVSRHKTEWLEGELSPKGSLAWVLHMQCHVLWCSTMAGLCGGTAGPETPWSDILSTSTHLQKGWGPPWSAHLTGEGY